MLETCDDLEYGILIFNCSSKLFRVNIVHCTSMEVRLEGILLAFYGTCRGQHWNWKRSLDYSHVCDEAKRRAFKQ